MKPDQSENQNATKQSLISSYRKNIYPLLKEELNQISCKPSIRSGGRSPSISTRKSLIYTMKMSLDYRKRSKYTLVVTFYLSGRDDQWTTSWWLQFKVLLGRGLKERKHEAYSCLRIFQVMSVSFLSGLLWWHCNTNHIMDQVMFKISLKLFYTL